MQDVGISLVDKSAEAFTPPKPKFDFAKSQGQSLGGAGVAASAAASAQSFADAAPRRLEVDASQPTTTLQLVMGGKKVRETANQDTTVMQLYQHFMSSVHKLTKCMICPTVHRLHRTLAHFALSVLVCSLFQFVWPVGLRAGGRLPAEAAHKPCPHAQGGRPAQRFHHAARWISKTERVTATTGHHNSSASQPNLCVRHARGCIVFAFRTFHSSQCIHLFKSNQNEILHLF